MKRVLLYLGLGSAAASRTTPDSAATARCSNCSETDYTPYNNSVLTGLYPKHQSGIKEETFFDSQAWLESDCEDFFSVQGENTPSLNTSPVRQKKTLRELLSESFDSRKIIDPNIFDDDKPREELSNTSFKLQRRKSSSESARHCFPGLVRSLSCSEWKKKRLSPVHLAQC